ncbi:conserved hypothetical protein [Escherichia coli IAI39]|uniref:Uncharacterized protein n=2 Tax=Escherichia coli TaxID=562 RepID=A0A0H2VAJ7_ECOL6|nr:Hypothetical protein c2384 [Escherichia coli CFT073]CAA0090611.1 conserved protein of unknown function [Escherichia coli]CAR17226.1 conserved hypothetical protein [Escherichia coli IAI39]
MLCNIRVKMKVQATTKQMAMAMVYLQLTLLTVSHLLVLMQTLTVLIGSLVMVKAKEPKFGRCQQNMTLTMSMLL